MADHLDKESLQSIRDCFDRLVTFMECIDRIWVLVKGTSRVSGNIKEALRIALCVLFRVAPKSARTPVHLMSPSCLPRRNRPRITLNPKP